MDENTFFLYDDTEQTRTRFVSFVGKSNRFDLAIVRSERFYGKSLVISIQNGRCAIIGQDDLEEEGYIAHVFDLSEEEAQELTEFLYLAV
jgi:predicted amidohydrolase